MKIYITKQEIIEAFHIPSGADIVIEGIEELKNDKKNSNDFWTITDPHNVKTSELIKRARKLFHVYVYDEKNIDKQFPAPKKDVVVSFRKSYEPDKKHQSKSYNDFIAEKNKTYMTMRQYIILVMKVWNEEEKHLDALGWTCTSSLWLDGRLVNGYWNGDDSELELDYGLVDYRYSFSGPREQFFF